jgi:hypothetical protein
MRRSTTPTRCAESTGIISCSTDVVHLAEGVPRAGEPGFFPPASIAEVMAEAYALAEKNGVERRYLADSLVIRRLAGPTSRHPPPVPSLGRAQAEFRLESARWPIIPGPRWPGAHGRARTAGGAPVTNRSA